MTNAELITELRGHIREVPLTLLRDAADAIEDLQTALNACRMRQGEQMPKHGEWTVCGMFGDFLKCSICGRSVPWTTETYHYCPNCGARMRKGEENER